MTRTATPAQSTHREGMLNVLRLFRVVFNAIRQHYQVVARRAGISGAQWWALSQVAERPGVRVGDLARALAIHRSMYPAHANDTAEAQNIAAYRRKSKLFRRRFHVCSNVY